MIDQFSLLDWSIFAFYSLLLVVTGLWFNSKAKSSKDYFLGGKQMPIWLVGVSVLATSQSAATFLGGPDQGYRGKLGRRHCGHVCGRIFNAEVLSI
jgi:Na+/proline symporter